MGTVLAPEPREQRGEKESHPVVVTGRHPNAYRYNNDTMSTAEDEVPMMVALDDHHHHHHHHVDVPPEEEEIIPTDFLDQDPCKQDKIEVREVPRFCVRRGWPAAGTRFFVQ
jgi:hypothetical protein